MNNTDSHKEIYVILGTPRGGTSAIARGLIALGVDLGNILTHASQRVNPKGFWEDKEIVRINRDIFKKLDCSSGGIAWIDKQQLTGKVVQPIKIAAVELLKQRFELTQSWGFKDPQTARLIPFWQSVFASLNLNENYIIALRNPLSSAQSHRNLSGANIETGLLLWLMHLIPAIEGTQGGKRAIINYELIMENPRKQLERIQKLLDIPSNQQTADIDQYVNEFLDDNLDHHKYSYEDLKSNPAIQVAPLCLRTYDLLLKVAKDELKFEDSEFVTAWQEILSQLHDDYPVYCYIDSLLNENHRLKKTLKSIHQSNLWKIIYPLRLINGRRIFFR